MIVVFFYLFKDFYCFINIFNSRTTTDTGGAKESVKALQMCI